MAAIQHPEGGNFLNFRLDQGWGEAQLIENPLVQLALSWGAGHVRMKSLISQGK
jgi:hypothetical protein